MLFGLEHYIYLELEHCHTEYVTSSSIIKYLQEDFFHGAQGWQHAGGGFRDRCGVYLLFKASVAEKWNRTLDHVCHNYPELTALNSAFLDAGYLGDIIAMAFSKQA